MSSMRSAFVDVDHQYVILALDAKWNSTFAAGNSFLFRAAICMLIAPPPTH
jgi:hypothetical protein